MMRRVLAKICLLMIALSLVPQGLLFAADLPATGKAIKLFNGRNLDQFDIFVKSSGLNPPSQHIFRVEDGVVHVSGEEYGYIVTKKDFENYYLRAEFKWGEETYEPRKNKARDSGILYHVYGENRVWPSSIEFQFIEGGTGDILLVDGPSLTVKGERKEKTGRFNRFGKGAWEDKAGYRDPNGDPEKPHGQWNVVELLVDGGHVKYWVNGKLVNEGTDSDPKGGKVLFQSEGAEVYFRNMEIRPLKQ
jgi:3-keto-disaccharide hydrolase